MTNDVDRWEDLPTESAHAESHELDRRTSTEIVELLLEEDRRGLERALAARDSIAAAAELLAEALRRKGRVLFAGAGTSGRLGVLEAAECPPTFGTDPEAIQGTIAGGEGAVFRAIEGAEDDAGAGRSAGADLSSSDLLIAVSASSVTPYARGAIEGAKQAGAGTVLLTCAPAEGLGELADLVIALDTGPEVVTGSTRLKAGSATKAALNAITTAAMVSLGKVYGDLMVDLRAGSAKLKSRAVRIVAQAAGTTPTRARELLEETGGEVKTAIAMALCGVGATEARRRLAAAGGHLRRAIERDV